MNLWICVVGGEENPIKGDDERIICCSDNWDDLLSAAYEYQTEVDMDWDKYFWIECGIGGTDPTANTYSELVAEVERYIRVD